MLARLSIMIVDHTCVAHPPYVQMFGDSVFWSPLHAAARTGNCDIASELLQAGADPNIQNKVLFWCV